MATTQPPRLETERLTLVAATVPMLRAELTDRGEFAQLLGAEIPSPWPPPLNDEASNRWMARYLEDHPNAAGWGMWFILLRRGSAQQPLAIGNGGYKGAPSPDGTVEIGYSIVEAHQRKGFGTEAARALVDRALRDPAVTRVIAETLPHLLPSIGVLRKCGFAQTGSGSDEGSIRFEYVRKTS